MELDFVQGFFERSCNIDEVGRAIVLTTNQVDMARRVLGRLRRERINCSIKAANGRAKLRVSGEESLRRWVELVGFEDPVKQQKLGRILESYRGSTDAEGIAGSAEGEVEASS